jgi:hypothetical protein
MDVEAERVIQCVYARRCKKSDENTDLPVHGEMGELIDDPFV